MNEEVKKSASAQSYGETKSQRAQVEEKVLEFWKENKIFQKTLEKDSPKGEYVFYEGPPTANGKPGIHHLEARAFKDAIPRYKTMQGFHVRRKGGWDTHGLPVELQVEKKLGLDSKKAIEDYGIAKFNKECKESVWEYTDLWEKFTDRIGYWVDQENPYVTYHNDYIESVWNVVKEANKQKLLYKDYKVVPWCPRCGTALSSHELAQGYEDVKDLSVYVKFKLVNQEDTYILAWTTTPWTLPGNVALAVGEDIDYVKIKMGNDFYFLAKERLSVIDGEYEIVKELKGKDLIGLEYEPLYPFTKDNIEGEEAKKLDKAYKVYPASFVTTEDGTGVVHTAVMYGQDDFELGNKIGLPKYHLVGLDGKFFNIAGFLSGKFVRDEETAVEIIKDLAHRGFLLKKEKYEHSYPHCWRCKTALVYYARDSWYIKMTELRDKMVKENEGINWEPAYIKEGRFGEWLRDIKDWAISRERYWGTPLPVWTCDKCKKIEVLGSLDEIKSKTKKSGNKYFVMRHGEGENNKQKIFGIDHQHNAKLTEIGQKQVLETAKNNKEKFDIVISSPFERARQTTEIFCKEISFPLEQIQYDERIQEWEIDKGFESKPMFEASRYYELDYIYEPEKHFKDGESFVDLLKRVGSFLYEINNKYQDKNILLSCHGGVSAAIQFIVNNYYLDDLKKNGPIWEFKNAEIREVNFIPFPHNEKYELDLHKPYIDEVDLQCSCGGKLERTKEVMDVWLDSGTMPFSQDHYPFENKEWVDGKGYPADFISEAIDQTRGWFYTLHAVGAIMGKGKAYKNVICLGHILDANGKKMSKSLGNIVDPWMIIDKYGVDTLRMWMYGVNQPGESKNFDEKTVSEMHNKIFNLLYNVLTFYELYRDKDLEKEAYKNSNNILDNWIIARLEELMNNVSSNLDNYKLLEPSRAIREFIDELSTWYLRRSRDRLKNGDKEAKRILYFVLKTLIKIMAPFAPFTSEDIWQKLKNEKDNESVHLSDWPLSISGADKKGLLEEMQKTREIVTLGLQARQKAGIPVRQPLSQLIITSLPEDKTGYQLPIEYQEIVKDELNVKEIEFKSGEEQKVELNTEITEELRKEGQYREFLRGIQDIRKKKGLNPNDVVSLLIETNVEGQEFINSINKDEFLKSVSAKDIKIKENNGLVVKVNDIEFKIELEK